MRNLLVVNDLPSVGKVALSAIFPITSSLGVETNILPTVLLSSHTGFDSFYKKNLTLEMIEILRQFQNMKLSFNTILTGYFYDENQINLFLEHIPQYERLIVDPIFADNGKLYRGFNQTYPKRMLELCKKADIIIPNLSEACFLADIPYLKSYTYQDITNLLYQLRNLGCSDILITGIEFDNEIGIMFYINNEIGYISYPKINFNFFGSGDILAALITALTIKSHSIKDSIQISLKFLNQCLIDTINSNQDIKYGILFEKNLNILHGGLYE